MFLHKTNKKPSQIGTRTQVETKQKHKHVPKLFILYKGAKCMSEVLRVTDTKIAFNSVPQKGPTQPYVQQ
jgi:hypothetical protein